MFAKKKLASSMMASFSSWSLGTKLSSVRTLATSGSCLSFSAMAEAPARLGSRISMVLGLVSGSRIRSSRVETDSTCFERRLSGLKSKLRPRRSGRPRTTAASVRPTTQLRCLSRKWSRGASQAQPTGAASPAGLRTASSAGSRVTVVKNAMIMPVPAISPSSDRPT